MGKCKSCSEELCEKKYEKRYKCDDPSNCSCTCQEEASATFWKAAGSIALGAAAFAGGVVLTVSTGGLGAVGIVAVTLGGAFTGAGATAAIHPVAKQLSGERMTGTEYAKDLFIGSTVGAITGPIGAGGVSATTSIASKVGTEGIKQGAVKLGCRAAVGAASGATASVIQESANLFNDKNAEFSVANILKGAALGAATGGAGHLTGNVANKVSPGVIRSVTKVAVNTAGTAAIDATCQLITEGEVDGKSLALNVGTRAATSAGYEVVAGATYKVQGGKEVLHDKLGDKEILDDISDSTDQEKIRQAQKYIEKLSPEAIEEQLRLAAKSSAAKKELRAVETSMSNTKTELQAVGKRINIVKDPNLPQESQGELLRPLQTQRVQLRGQLRRERATLSKLNEGVSNRPKPAKMGEQNIHALSSEHYGQFAADLPEENQSGRGSRRVVFDLKASRDGEVIRTKIAGFIDDHDYSKVPGYGRVELPKLIEVEPFILPRKCSNCGRRHIDE